jgi:subtilase family serine protease
MANLVTFAKKLWKDKVGGNTPITAAELNRIESGVNDCANQINKLGDSVSRVPAFWGDVTSITYGSWGSGDGTYIQMQFCLKDGKSLYATISKAEGIQLQYGTAGNIKTLWTK